MSDRRKRAKTMFTHVDEPVSPQQLANSIYSLDAFQDVDENLTLVQPDGSIQFGSFIMKREGLQLDGEITQQDWIEFGQRLNQLKDSIQWILGDWANLGMDKADEWITDDDVIDEKSSNGKYKRLLEKTDYAYGTLSNFASVSRKIPFPRRRGNLTYSHHVEVAYNISDEEEQDYYLDLAEQGDENGILSVRKLRDLVRYKDSAPPNENPLDRVFVSAEKAYQTAQKQAENTSGGERQQWRVFAEEQARKWQELAKKLDQ